MSPSSLVLLHGASGHSATWAPLLPWLGWTALSTPDLPGRGAEPGPPRDTVAGLADWLAARLAAEARPAPVVLGHSLGGAVALQLALDHPEAVGALVLVSSASRLRVHPLILEAVRASTPAAPYRLDAAFGPGASQAVKDAYAQASAATPPEAALADWLACDAFDVRARLSEVRIPTLLVHGSEDALTPARFQALLADALPNAQRIELPGVGHMLPWEAPEALAATVRAWVEAL